MGSDQVILKIRNLFVDFPIFGGLLQRKVDAVHAVKNVSLDLLKGETLGIVGESGSGKSTLGNAVLNVLKLNWTFQKKIETSREWHSTIKNFGLSMKAMESLYMILKPIPLLKSNRQASKTQNMLK